MINAIPIRTQQAGTLPAQTTGTTIDIGSITNLMLIMVVMVMMMKMMSTATKNI